MDALIVLLGFFVGLAIFFFIMNRITAIVYNCSSVVFTFFVCWGIGIVLAWIAWRIALIIGIIALVIFLWSKLFGTKSSSAKNQENTDQNDENTKGE